MKLQLSPEEESYGGLKWCVSLWNDEAVHATVGPYMLTVTVGHRVKDWTPVYCVSKSLTWLPKPHAPCESFEKLIDAQAAAIHYLKSAIEETRKDLAEAEEALFLCTSPPDKADVDAYYKQAGQLIVKACVRMLQDSFEKAAEKGK